MCRLRASLFFPPCQGLQEQYDLITLAIFMIKNANRNFQERTGAMRAHLSAGTDTATLYGMKNEQLKENWEFIRSELKRKYSSISEEELKLSNTDCAEETLKCLAHKLGKDKEDLRQEIALSFAEQEQSASQS